MGRKIVDIRGFANIFFIVSTSFGKMSHHFTIEDVFRNFVKVLHALRFIAAEITTGDVSEAVIPVTRSIATFFHSVGPDSCESGTDICYPVPGLGNLYFENFSAPSEVRLSIRDVRWQMEESARIEDFMRVYEARHLLTAQLIRHYGMMVEPYQSRHRANLYYEIQAETVFEDLLLLLPTNGRRRPRPY
ncbi:hypothetical protein DAPPUDRAFT_117134 [Daphnia pulex]|uniref:Uncharacterized protein n=1 Tax=Daphnia pulex TaxID=6669 RepID=E9HRN3_DAPPU|nr:hypothetical protein DAPPUDRAFT_117134 [Daphnia pulex]|eukprot:EFX65601.1 hypothetical protein DAPPUDRAFT_117134 [Daphnia pulex]